MKTFSTLLLLLLYSNLVFADIALIISGEIGQKANVRSGPQIKSSIVGQVKKGEAYKIIDRDEDWYKIKFGDKQGWIHKNLLRIDKEKISPPPAPKKEEKKPAPKPQTAKIPEPKIPEVKKPEVIKTIAPKPIPPPSLPIPPVETKIKPLPKEPPPLPPKPLMAKLSMKDMVFIPRGEFLMGNAQGSKGESDEYPQHKVYIDSFYINKHEVTNREFDKFIRQTNFKTDAEKIGRSWVWKEEWQEMMGANWAHPQGKQSNALDLLDHPVVQVSWNDASEYCRIAKQRLPTEAEWEKSARGKENTIFPWGNDWDSQMTNSWKKGTATTTLSVGSFPRGASSYGLFDMAGNVAEWVSDWYDENYYSKSPPTNPSGPSSGILRVIRGGSWLNTDPFYLRSVDRTGAIPESSWIYLGFRCAANEQ